MERPLQDLARKMQETCRKIGLEFDMPVKKLGFGGKVNRQQVTLYPSNHSLIALDDEPPVVIALKDIEIVSLERINFQLRNFDMTVIYKDFSQNPQHITTIETKHLDRIRDWLNQNNIIFRESPVNLVWKTIMKQIRSDMEGFFGLGGWSYIFDAEEGEEEEGDVSSAASAYEPSDDDGEESEEYASESMSESEDDEWESGSGEDWEELHKNARASDNRKRGFGENSDDERPARKKTRARR